MTNSTQTQLIPPEKVQDINRAFAQLEASSKANGTQGQEIRRSLWVNHADGTYTHFHSRAPSTPEQIADYEFYTARQKRWQARADRIFQFIKHPLRELAAFFKGV